METAEHREPYDARVCAVKTAGRILIQDERSRGEMLLGQPPYRMAKALRDKSMVVKRGLGEHAKPDALQDPRDMVKAGLLEP